MNAKIIFEIIDELAKSETMSINDCIKHVSTYYKIDSSYVKSALSGTVYDRSDKKYKDNHCYIMGKLITRQNFLTSASKAVKKFADIYNETYGESYSDELLFIAFNMGV